MHKQVDPRCRRAFRAFRSIPAAIQAAAQRASRYIRCPSPREWRVAGALGAALVAAAFKWPDNALAATPMYAAFTLGLLLRVPRPRRARTWPPSRLFQCVEWYALELRAGNTTESRLVSPFVSQSLSGLLHAPIIANFSQQMWTDAWWLVLIEVAAAYALFAGTLVSLGRWLKFRSR